MSKFMKKNGWSEKNDTSNFPKPSERNKVLNEVIEVLENEYKKHIDSYCIAVSEGQECCIKQTIKEVGKLKEEQE